MRNAKLHNTYALVQHNLVPRPVECRWLADGLDWMKKEHRDAVRICIDNGRFRWRSKTKPEAKVSRKYRKKRPSSAQLGGKFTMQAPAHLQPKVVTGPPSRKRSCPEPDGRIERFVIGCTRCVGTPMHGCPKSGSLFTPLANDVVDARPHVHKTFFLGSCCTNTRLPKYFSVTGEKLCFPTSKFL